MSLFQTDSRKKNLICTLPVDVGPCGAGRFLHIKIVILEVTNTFLDIRDFGKPRMTQTSYLTMKYQVLYFLKVMFARPSAAGDIYTRPRSKILLSAHRDAKINGVDRMASLRKTISEVLLLQCEFERLKVLFMQPRLSTLR